MIINTPAYHAIVSFYNTRAAVRSGVPYINHINEGIVVLKAKYACAQTIDAYCLHPIVQTDEDLRKNFTFLTSYMDIGTLAFALEYRNIANAYLRERVIDKNEQIQLSPLFQVNNMLIADKVQNRKDFITYHKGTHPHSDALDRYFTLWLEALGITEDEYQWLCSLIDEWKADHSSSSS